MKSNLVKWLIISLFVLIFAGITFYFINLEKFVSSQSLLLTGQEHVSPGSSASFRLAVFNKNKVISNAKVKLSLISKDKKEQIVYQGVTNKLGTIDFSFLVPADLKEGAYDLKATVESGSGKDVVTKGIIIKESFKVLLSTDKPFYQPNQEIFIRSLVLSTFRLKPIAGKEITFIIEDAKGNIVFKEKSKLSEFGVGSAKFQLAKEINQGLYKIKAVLNEQTTEKTVTVKSYVLPKFKISLRTEKNYYLPAQKLNGQLNVNYFFGKPVSNGKVEITLSSFDAEFKQFAKISGTTNENGLYSFNYLLPQHFVGQPLTKGNAIVKLGIKVTDQANHTEEISHTLTVAKDNFQVTFLPENGKIVQGLDNVIYVITTSPDDSPVQAEVNLQVRNAALTAKTNKTGLGYFTLPAYVDASRLTNVPYTATDSYQQKTNGSLNLSELSGRSLILVRTKKRIYQAGETAEINFLSAGSTQNVYFDVIKDKQIVLSQSLALANRTGIYKLPLTGEMTGTIEISAYHLTPQGQIERTSYIFFVKDSKDLAINLKTDKDVYRPGEKASLKFEVKNKEQQPVQTSLGVNIVDESVFALSDKETGLEKTYFTLVQEQLKPRYEICTHYLNQIREQDLNQGKEQEQLTANVALTNLSGQEKYGFYQNTYPEKLAQAQKQKTKYFEVIFKLLLLVLMLIPPVTLLLALANDYAKHKSEEKHLVQISEQPTFTYLLIYVLGYFVFGLLTLLLAVCGNMLRDANNFLMFIIFGILLLLLIIYSWLMLKGAVHEAINKVTTLRVSFYLSFTYTAVILLIVLFLSALKGTSVENFPDIEPYLILSFISLLCMPFIILYSTLSHTLKPLKSKVLGVVRMGVFVLGSIIVIVVPLLLLIQLFSQQTRDASIRPSTPVLRNEGIVKYATKRPTEAMDSPEITKPAETKPKTYLRQYFPETMYSFPELITTSKGKVDLSVKLADSITTWRISVIGSTQQGEIGTLQAPLRVFQDFFIDVDLPSKLTQGDEISLPIALYNYLPSEQKITLTLKKERWFSLLEQEQKTVTLEPKQVSVVYFKIKARYIGTHDLTITAQGDKISDAVKKQVAIEPSGQVNYLIHNGSLEGNISKVIDLPPSAQMGSKIFLKFYPGAFSQVIDGLESLLGMPHGCFEQTTSSTYPNILVLNYLKKTGKSTAQTQLKAEKYISLGYQRMLTFEVDGGGFSLYGKQPASIWLSAYGLSAFSDMSAVYPVDERLIEKTKKWLLNKQASDGSWENNQLITAYIALVLLETGTDKTNPVITKALNYLKEKSKNSTDAYFLAICANVFVIAQPKDSFTDQLLNSLVALKKEEGAAVFWTPLSSTLSYSYGTSGSIETTSLVARALLRSLKNPELLEKSFQYILSKKDSRGGWYTTSTTINVLKTLVLGAKGSSGEGKISVLFNEEEVKDLPINAETSDVVQLVDLEKQTMPGRNSLEINCTGSVRGLYQIVTKYYTPWTGKAKQEPLSININYDRSSLAKDNLLKAKVITVNNTSKTANLVIIDLGIPPGFAVMTDDFAQLKEKGIIDRYDLTENQIILYIPKINTKEKLTFTYTLKAKFPVTVQTPLSYIYEYYNQEEKGTSQPLKLQVQ